MFQIATARLRLRPIDPSDAEMLWRMHQDPEVSRFLEKPPRSLEEATEVWRRHIEVYYNQRGLGMLATTVTQTGELVGICGYLTQQVDGAIETEVAYRLRREFWGHGYATEAARALIDYAFSDLKRTRVISLIHPENTRSARVAQRAGMAYERDVSFIGQQVGLFAKNAV